MIVQKFVVKLSDAHGPTGRQVWLGYDCSGRIGTSDYSQAFRYSSEREAVNALGLLRHRGSKWPSAEILATLVESDGQ